MMTRCLVFVQLPLVTVCLFPSHPPPPHPTQDPPAPTVTWTTTVPEPTATWTTTQPAPPPTTATTTAAPAPLPRITVPSPTTLTTTLAATLTTTPPTTPVAVAPREIAPSSKRLHIEDKPTVAPQPSAQSATEEKRRWGLAMLIMIVAAGAGAARMARRR